MARSPPVRIAQTALCSPYVGDEQTALGERAPMEQATWWGGASRLDHQFRDLVVLLERPTIELEVHCDGHLPHPFVDSVSRPDGVR
jgi:hypothetical protein